VLKLGIEKKGKEKEGGRTESRVQYYFSLILSEKHLLSKIEMETTGGSCGGGDREERKRKKKGEKEELNGTGVLLFILILAATLFRFTPEESKKRRGKKGGKKGGGRERIGPATGSILALSLLNNPVFHSHRRDNKGFGKKEKGRRKEKKKRGVAKQ